MSDAQQRIDELVKTNDVLLFMKGNASFPACAAFPAARSRSSRPAASTPRRVKTVNVLEDDEIRQGIKEYSNWPTIPQLYVKGEFVGGSDIMMEMYESGELQQVLTAGRGLSRRQALVMATTIRMPRKRRPQQAGASCMRSAHAAALSAPA